MLSKLKLIILDTCHEQNIVNENIMVVNYS